MIRVMLLALVLSVTCVRYSEGFAVRGILAGQDTTSTSNGKTVLTPLPRQHMSLISKRTTTAIGAASNERDEEPKKQGGILQAIGGFFEELDAFMDDASARRLGNGAAFYGKRRSNFYGKNDKNKKRDRTVFDPTEDYRGPSSSGFFKWMPDEDGEMRPVTRMKNRVIEKRGWFSGSSDDE